MALMPAVSYGERRLADISVRYDPAADNSEVKLLGGVQVPPRDGGIVMGGADAGLRPAGAWEPRQTRDMPANARRPRTRKGIAGMA